MFTGIVEELGRVVLVEADLIRIEADSVLTDVTIGASVAVNGSRTHWPARPSVTRGAGAPVNSEVDVFAKYVERLPAPRSVTS